MKILKNIAIGFGVSFIGSVPLGYLNVIGYHIYDTSGMGNLLPYLIGVMIIESLVIYGTLVFAQRLMRNEKLMWYIELFSIVFMLVLAWYFHSSATGEALPEDATKGYENLGPFLKGIVFSCFNFMQIPFWTGWNVYVVNERYISNDKKLWYVGGSLIGTFTGMLVFILVLGLLTSKSDFMSDHLLSAIIPFFFIGMALYQSFKFYRKYYRKANA